MNAGCAGKTEIPWERVPYLNALEVCSRHTNPRLPLPLHTPEYTLDFLTPVANIPSRSTLRASSCGNLVVPRTRRANNWRQSLFCCCTASMEQATYGAETAAIDGLVSWWSENISVLFCLRAPGYGSTLWCTLGLLLGGYD